MANEIVLADIMVGEGHPCFIIGEVGLAHDGSLGMAHSYIDAIAEAGADAVKFQTHIAHAEGTKDEKFRVNVFPQDNTRYDYWMRTQFSEDQWKSLKTHAEKNNLIFLSSPFSIEAVRLLSRIGIQAWKIGSGETGNIPMLNEILKSGKPVLLSTGMDFFSEIDETVNLINDGKAPLILYQCTSAYPCPPEEIGLNMIGELRSRYNAPVGYSDHSGKVCAGIAAHALGACSIETHVVMNKKCFGPDTNASLDIEEFAELVSSIRYMETVYANDVNKDRQAENLKEMKALFSKSVVAKVDISSGSELTDDNLTTKKPGNGISARDYYKVIGKKTKRDFTADELITWDGLIDG